MERGVPQRSVLGPLLWNIAFDRVLRSPLLQGCHVVCYADDTLVLAEREDWGEARLRVEAALHSVVGTISDLGLKVAPQKTQAMCLAPRVRKVGTALAGLMRAQGGPGWQARHLYVGVVLSVALYGVPRLLATRRYRDLLRQATQPVLGAPRKGGGLSAKDLRALKTQAGNRILNKWSAELADPRGFGRQTAEAGRPCLPEIVGRRGRGQSFHLVQVLTGHGCFGGYLHRIRKELTTECHYCPKPDDSARHTLAECKAWSQERRFLARAVGCRVEDLSLPRMVRAMCGSGEAWGAAASFCRDVMSQKEAAKWERRPNPDRRVAKNLSCLLFGGLPHVGQYGRSVCASCRCCGYSKSISRM
ncbi:uncharacterized protein LOC105190473 [Harpegnathos saltator]|uniref:uncharacterized protein LOC105190473 n=1 Tax=Harpegnathos saltator TaxID=610380 RepID=UPI000DBED1F6|nr:uncharacterized protein LOC105190473 [Harpegnathos saltator]